MSSQAGEECRFVGIRVVAGQEYNVAVIIKSRVELMSPDKRKYYNVASIVVPHLVQGQVYLETPYPYVASDLASGIKQYRGLMMGVVATIDEILRMIRREVKVKEGDIVEIITEPFRGFRARVVAVDEKNGTVRLVLLDTPANIPVNLSIKSIRLIESGKGG